jgi:Repeat of unknown function (DUF5648)
VAQTVCGSRGDAVPLLRSYHPEGDHFYTIDPAEHANAIKNYGYLEETVAGYMFATAEPHSVPLYRVWNSELVDHFYTTDLSERDRAIRDAQYVSEGIAGYLYPDAACGGVPLLRVYKESVTDHFYTVKQGERDFAVATGSLPEGTTGYMFAV